MSSFWPIGIKDNREGSISIKGHRGSGILACPFRLGLGMLVGMRLDRALEAHAAADGAALSGPLNPNPDVINGPEENRGE